MADGTVRVPPDDLGKRIDTTELSVEGLTVERQRVQLAGGADVEVAGVKNALPSSTEYGSVVRHPAHNVNTGIEAPASAVLVDASGIANGLAFELDGVAFVNNAGTVKTVGVANGSSQYLIAPFELADKASLHVACHGRPVTGLKWLAPTGVTVQAWGRK